MKNVEEGLENVNWFMGVVLVPDKGEISPFSRKIK